MTTEAPEQAPAPIPDADDELLDMLRRLLAMKRVQTRLKDQIPLLQAEIDRRMAKRAAFTDRQGRRFTATKVVSETLQVDLAKLSALSPEVYDRVTKRTFDGGAWDKAVDAGLVTKEVIAAVATFKESKPSVRFYEVDETTAQEATDE